MNQKIIFAGLERAGKTSIINSFLNKFQVINTRPTLNIERKPLSHVKWMGWDITNWDLGGQKQYRTGYISHPEIFYNTFALFFIIDIQDSSRFDDSFKYLGEIIDILKNDKQTPKLVIAFHKFDPEEENSKKMLEYEQNIQLLTQKVKKEVTYINPIIYSTSIYDEASISMLFYDNLLAETPKGQQIQAHLNQFAQLTSSTATLLLDSSALIVGSQYTEKKYLHTAISFATWQVITMDKIKRYSITVNKITSQLHSEGENGHIFIEMFKVHDLEFSLVSLTKNRDTVSEIEKYLPELVKQLSNLIEIYY